jgi:polyisoprenoid-binding protein YceI
MAGLMRSESRLLRLVPAALLVLLALPARAEPWVVEFDPAKARVEFTLGAFLHAVHGTLKLKEGRIEVDPATGHCSGRIVLDALSADTGNDGRDNKMHKEILETQKYPDITFTPTQLQGSLAPQGDSELELRGTIALHGTEQEIAVPIKVHISGTEWSGEAAFPVPYVKWGLKNPSTLFLRVKDTVNVTVQAAGRIEPTAIGP